MKETLLKLTTDQIINCIPSNMPICKYSGLWSIYDSDQFKDELFNQKLNETFKDFLIRSILGMIESDEVETESMEIDIALCSVDEIEMNIYKIKMQGEVDYVCANTIIEALQLLYIMSGLEIYDYISSDGIEKIQKIYWDSFSFKNDKNKTIIFSDFMRDVKTPQIICSTAY